MVVSDGVWCVVWGKVWGKVWWYSVVGGDVQLRVVECCGALWSVLVLLCMEVRGGV